MPKDICRIKRRLTTFFVVVIVIQPGLVCYAAQYADPTAASIADVKDQLDEIQRISIASLLSIVLNLVAITVSVYGVNRCIINSFRGYTAAKR